MVIVNYVYLSFLASTVSVILLSLPLVSRLPLIVTPVSLLKAMISTVRFVFGFSVST